MQTVVKIESVQAFTVRDFYPFIYGNIFMNSENVIEIKLKYLFASFFSQIKANGAANCENILFA